MPPETQTEAILKLKILDGENLKDLKHFARVKMKSFVLAWIDPRFKQSTKTLTTSTKNPTWNFDLDLPLSLQTLHNLNSCLTLQVVSPASAFHPQRVVGTAVLPISDVKFREEVFTLQLWRPSGRARGLVRVMARIEINLGFYRLDELGNQTILHRTDNVAPSAPMEDHLTELEVSGDAVETISSCDSVQLAPVEMESKCGSSCNSIKLQSVDVDPGKNVESVCNCGSSCSSVQLPLGDCHARKTDGLHCNCGSSCNSVLPESRDESSNVLRSLLVGFLGGAVAVATVLIGGADG